MIANKYYLSLFSLGIREKHCGANTWDSCKSVPYNSAAENESSFTKVKDNNKISNSSQQNALRFKKQSFICMQCVAAYFVFVGFHLLSRKVK